MEGSALQFWEVESQIHKGFWLGTTPDAKERAVGLTAQASALLESQL